MLVSAVERAIFRRESSKSSRIRVCSLGINAERSEIDWNRENVICCVGGRPPAAANLRLRKCVREGIASINLAHPSTSTSSSSPSSSSAPCMGTYSVRRRMFIAIFGWSARNPHTRKEWQDHIFNIRRLHIQRAATHPSLRHTKRQFSRSPGMLWGIGSDNVSFGKRFSKTSSIVSLGSA